MYLKVTCDMHFKEWLLCMFPSSQLLDAHCHAVGGTQSERPPLRDREVAAKFYFIFQLQRRECKAASVYGTNNELY